MKFLLNIIFVFFFFNVALAENHLQFFIDSALKNNLKLLPDENEIYLAKFYRNDKLSSNSYIVDSIKKFVFPLIKKSLGMILRTNL